PEAPVPIVAVESVNKRLGGAANVVQNLAKLNVNVKLISVCGKDEYSKELLRMLETIGCTTEGVLCSSHRITTVKTRVIASHQQIVRVDRELIKELNKKELSSLEKTFNEFFTDCNGVIISDYAKGVITSELMSTIIDKCKKNNIFIAVDPKKDHLSLYKDVSAMTPNLKEAHILAGTPIHHNCSLDEIENLGWKIIEKYSLSTLLITLSERGMAVFTTNPKNFTHLPTVARKVFDVTGAGDTVISVFTAAITGGATPLEAAFLANNAAGLTVAEIGTASVTPDELLRSCREVLNLV
ncbi:MAG: PfkB family carbohydrate kinase, partial [Chitinispirillaceae bacterium]|nr:PfkB family carbohydrate kinase [Chitinispirillaceae bacterium]